MIQKSIVHLALAALLAAATSCSKTPKEESASKTETQSAPIARGEAASIQVAFSVQAVDVQKRLITLKGPNGNTGVYEVGDQVQRLSEIKAGDTIHAEYTVAAAAELREPTADEKETPIMEVSNAQRGPSEAPPAAGVGRVVRAVASIESLDPTAQSVTVKGPEEGLVTVHVEDPTVFAKLKVGEPIVVTFAEKLVLSVQPGAKS